MQELHVDNYLWCPNALYLSHWSDYDVAYSLGNAWLETLNAKMQVSDIIPLLVGVISVVGWQRAGLVSLSNQGKLSWISKEMW